MPRVGAAIVASIICLIVLIDCVEFAFGCGAEIIRTHFIHV